MTTTSIPGPQSTIGVKPPITGPTPTSPNAPPIAIVPENPDFAPDLSWMGVGVRDPRYLARIGAGPIQAGGYANQDCGWLLSSGLLCCDYVPNAIVSGNLVAAAHTTAGTAMTLAGASTGITVAPAGGVYVQGSMKTIPAGALIIDGNPSYIGSGASGAFAFWNPATGASRAISVVSSSGGTVSFKINGFDLYGVPQTETLVASGASIVSTKKTYKAIGSIVPATTDGTHNFAFSTTDVYGFAIRVPTWPFVQIFYGTPPAQVLITSATGFLAADNTTPALTTGEVRGSYALQSASDGTKRLTIFAAVPFGVIASTPANAVIGLLGKTPA